MKAILFTLICILISSSTYSLDVTLNTQLDKKLKKIKHKGVTDKSFQFNIVRKITILGLKTIPEETVRNEISVFIGDELNPHIINRNIKRILSVGYFEDVTSSLKNYEGGKEWILTIEENPIVKKVVFKGNSKISAKKLDKVLETKLNEVFNISNARKDIAAIENKYKEDGYLFTKVSKTEAPTEESGTLVYNIQESFFNTIVVSGNTKTKDYVILREIEIKEGDRVDQNEVKKTLQRIYNLNFFSEVVPDIFPIKGERNAYNLSIKVKEKSTDSLNFGGGWGQRNGLFIYSDLNINNFAGTGQLVALRGQWGGNNETYQFKYRNPWMFGKRKSLTYRLWNTRGNFEYNNLMRTGDRPEQRVGTDVRIGLPHNYNIRSYHGAKFEKVNVKEYDGNSNTGYSIQSYDYTLSYDTRDVVFNPLNGAYYTASVENGFKFRKDSLVFTRYDLSLSNFFQTFKNQTIATRFVAGRIFGNVEFTEYYYVGGPNTVRGYLEYPNSFGVGRAQLFTNIEYRFLINNMFQVLFFIDAGWASFMGRDFTKGKIGKGTGVRINSPLGPIRIDLGIDELGEMRTHFNIGHVF